MMNATFHRFSPYVLPANLFRAEEHRTTATSMWTPMVKEFLLKWLDVRHQGKVIDRQARRPTVRHVVAARDTATVADTRPLPIRPLLTPPREAVELAGAAEVGPPV